MDVLKGLSVELNDGDFWTVNKNPLEVFGWTFCSCLAPVWSILNDESC